MAEVTQERKGELMRGVFEILLAHPDGLQAKLVLAQLENVVPPTEFEQGYYASNPSARRYEKIVRFATIGPVKAGWLEKDKGLWFLTEEGKKAFDRLKDPQQFSAEASLLYKKWKQDRPDPEVEEDQAEEAESATRLLGCH